MYYKVYFDPQITLKDGVDRTIRRQFIMQFIMHGLLGTSGNYARNCWHLLLGGLIATTGNTSRVKWNGEMSRMGFSSQLNQQRLDYCNTRRYQGQTFDCKT